MTQADIKSVRNDLGLSQSKMAEVMCVPVKTLQRWELTRKITNPAAEQLVKTIIWFHSNDKWDDYLSI